MTCCCAGFNRSNQPNTSDNTPTSCDTTGSNAAPTVSFMSWYWALRRAILPSAVPANAAACPPNWAFNFCCASAHDNVFSPAVRIPGINRPSAVVFPVYALAIAAVTVSRSLPDPRETSMASRSNCCAFALSLVTRANTATAGRRSSSR